MKWFYFVFLFIILLFNSNPVFADKKIVLNTMESEPYQSKYLANNGFLVEISKKAFKRAGYDLEVRFVPWKRAIVESVDGLVDGVLGAWYNDERTKLFAYTDTIGESRLIFLKRKDQVIKYNTLQDLEKFRIGVVNGYTYTKEFDQSPFLMKEVVVSSEINLRKLIYKRIDLTPDIEEVISYILKTKYPEHLGTIETVGEPLKVHMIYNIISKKNSHFKKIVQDFNSGLKSIKEDGTYDSVVKKSKELLCPIVRTDNLTGITVNITDDGAEWPPYTYYRRENGKKTKEIIGFSVDVITEIFKKHNIKYTIRLLPWKRALISVERGKKYQMFLSGSFSEERAAKYHISRSYYTLNHVAFYSAKKYPDGLSVKSIDDIKKNYQPLGLMGYNYSAFGFNPDEINQNGFHSYAQLLKVLHNRKSVGDLFIEGYEIFAGFRAIGEDYLSGRNLKYTQIPGVPPTTFHMMISKNVHYGRDLKALIDNGITELETSGKLEKFKIKYDLIHFK